MLGTLDQVSSFHLLVLWCRPSTFPLCLRSSRYNTICFIVSGKITTYSEHKWALHMRKHFANTRAVRQGSSPNRAEGLLCPRLSGAESGGVTGTQANHSPNRAEGLLCPRLSAAESGGVTGTQANHSPNRAGAYYVPGSVVQSRGETQVHKLITHPTELGPTMSQAQWCRVRGEHRYTS